MFGDTVGLIFKISADDTASEEIKKLRKVIDSETSAMKLSTKDVFNSLGTSAGLSTKQVASLGTALPIVGTAIAGFAATASSAAFGLFGLAKNFSDYGSAIKDASDKTGLHAETLTALKYAGDQSDTSIQQISKSVSKFSLLVTDAANGSKEATAKLKSLGLEPQSALKDLDGSLSAVFKRIVELKPGFEQNAAASAAFGAKMGSELLPFIKQFDGDLPGLIKKAKELGVTLSDDDVEAADAFGDQLAELKSITQSVANTFAKEFTPGITSAMGEVGKLLIANKDAFKNWGEYVGDIIRGVSTPSVNLPTPDSKSYSELTDQDKTQIGFFKGYQKYLAEGLRDAANLAMDSSSTGGLARTISLENAANRGKRLREEQEAAEKNVVRVSSDDVSKLRNKDDEALFAERAEKAKKEAEKRAKERKEAFEKELAARSQQNKILLSTARDDYASAQKDWEDAFLKRTVTQEAFQQQSLANLEKYGADVKKRLASGFELDRAGKTGTELANAGLEYKQAAAALDREIASERADIQKTVTDSVKKETEDRARLAEQDAERQITLNKSATARKLSDLELAHKLSNDSEKKYLAERDNLIYQSLKAEEQINKALLKNSALSPEKQAAITLRLKEIANEIANGFNETTIRNIESFNKAIKAVDDIFKDFGLTVAGSGFKTGLQELNALLADPEITEALKRRAEAIGVTTEQLKELLRVQQEGKDKGLTTGTRERVVDDGLSGAATKQSRKGIAGSAAGIFGDLVGGGIDPENKIKDQAELMKGVYGDLAESSKAAIGSMVQGLGQLAAQWLSTGKFSAKAALQMVSGIAAGLAIEAGLKALMQYAEGVALAANPFTAALAPGHFAAAAAYGIAAAAAGAVAVGTGVASRAFGGGGSASSSSFKKQTASGNYDFRTDPNNSSGNDRDKVIVREEDRSGRQEVVYKHVVEIQTKDSHIVSAVRNDIDNRGSLHGLIIKYAER